MLASMFASSLLAQTAEHPNYPVVVVDQQDGVIAIIDDIDFRTPLAFERTLTEVPNASVLLLDSPGGGVHSALAIASRVRGLSLTTIILPKSSCLSACALVFLAGSKRLADGQLGVHQISSASGQDNLVGGQFALADVIEALDKYDAPRELIGLMLRTPPEDMYLLSSEEKQRFGFAGGQFPPTNNSEVPRAYVDLANPETWRGKVITGELISSGKKWYAKLNQDGTTTFQFASGKRSDGRYHVTKEAVCFKLDLGQSYSCRRPVRGSDGIRWYDEQGNFHSVIVSVNDKDFGAISEQQGVPASVSDYIKPGDCALIVASRPTISAAREYVRSNIRDRRYLKAFRSENGWVAISIGTLKPQEVDPIMSEWKASGRIPQDSYCSTGSNYISAVDLQLN
jgi:hypothetical protein